MGTQKKAHQFNQHRFISRYPGEPAEADRCKICSQPRNHPYHQEKLKAAPIAPRCEGWRRRGGAFSLGPVSWTQCNHTATVSLTFIQFKEPKRTMPACQQCWKEASTNEDIKIIKAEPL